MAPNTREDTRWSGENTVHFRNKLEVAPFPPCLLDMTRIKLSPNCLITSDPIGPCFPQTKPLLQSHQTKK